MAIEYLGLSEINGPLVVLDGVQDAAFDEIVEFKNNYSEEQKKSDMECLGTLVSKGDSLPNNEVTFKKMFDQGKQIRI